MKLLTWNILEPYYKHYNFGICLNNKDVEEYRKYDADDEFRLSTCKAILDKNRADIIHLQEAGSFYKYILLESDKSLNNKIVFEDGTESEFYYDKSNKIYVNQTEVTKNILHIFTYKYYIVYVPLYYVNDKIGHLADVVTLVDRVYQQSVKLDFDGYKFHRILPLLVNDIYYINVHLNYIDDSSDEIQRDHRKTELDYIDSIKSDMVIISGDFNFYEKNSDEFKRRNYSDIEEKDNIQTTYKKYICDKSHKQIPIDRSDRQLRVYAKPKAQRYIYNFKTFHNYIYNEYDYIGNNYKLKDSKIKIQELKPPYYNGQMDANYVDVFNKFKYNDEYTEKYNDQKAWPSDHSLIMIDAGMSVLTESEEKVKGKEPFKLNTQAHPFNPYSDSLPGPATGGAKYYLAI